LLVKLKEEGMKTVVEKLDDKKLPKFYAYLNRAILIMVSGKSIC